MGAHGYVDVVVIEKTESISMDVRVGIRGK